MGDQCIISAPLSSEGYVELGATPKARGRVFRKHILNLGDLHYKGKTFTLDDAWFSRVKRNFEAGVSMCQVPLANDKNEHTEDPLRNTGEIIGLEREGSKVYDLIDVRDPEAAQRLADGRILGASAFLNMDYEDTRTGEKVGPALLHHCLTNRPHVLDLEPYEEVVAAAAADSEGEDFVVLASPEGTVPTREELLAQLKAEHGIDVEALQAQAAQRTDMSGLTAALTEALRPAAGAVSLSGDGGEEVTLTDVVGAVAELAEKNVTLTGTVGDLRKKDAEREIDGYIGAGRLLPKSRRKAIELVLSGDREGLEDFLAPEKEPYVRLNHVEGAAPPQGEQRHAEDIGSEIMRLTASHGEFFTPGGNGKARK
jgi:hypothetical protein